MQSPRAVLMLKHQSMVPSLHAVNPSVEVDWNRTCASGKWFFGILCRLVSSCNCLSDGIDQTNWSWLIHINSLIINPCFIEVDLGHSATHTFCKTFFRGHLWVSRPCQKAGKVRSPMGLLFWGGYDYHRTSSFRSPEEWILDFGLYNLFVEESKSEFDNMVFSVEVLWPV